MNFKNKTAVVFGGTGFVGRHIIKNLADLGVRVKVATRVPERAYFLKPLGDIGQVVPVTCDYNNATDINQITRDVDMVVNCIGILYERGQKTFEHAHVSIPKMIAKACSKNNVTKFVHISALGIEESSSKYAASKYDGEKAIIKIFPNVSILRPSVIFGEDDEFFNMFAKLLPYVPFMPLIGGGHTRFQPVYVCDVAEATIRCLESADTHGEIYELGGTDVLSFKDVYQKIFQYTGQTKPLLKLPFSIAKFEAFFLQFLPKPLLTPDQVESLKSDNIVMGNKKTLDDLDITPTDMGLILPEYLTRYRKGGRFSTV